MNEEHYLKKHIDDLELLLRNVKERLQFLKSKPLIPQKRTFAVILDFGHGGISPEGNYTTSPAKMYYHSNENFHENGNFYEGIFNRILGEKIKIKLKNLGFQVFVVSHSWKDTPLHSRVWKANEINKKLRAEGKKSVFLSIHGNASQTHTASGWSVFVSRKASKTSRFFADLIGTEIKSLAPEIQFRAEQAGALYWERNFTVLARTEMPAILTENLFYDFLKDAKLMHSEEFQNILVNAHVNAILKLEKEK